MKKTNIAVEIIRKARMKQGISQRNLGNAVSKKLKRGWTDTKAQTLFSLFERGKNSLTDEEVQAAYQLLGIKNATDKICHDQTIEAGEESRNANIHTINHLKTHQLGPSEVPKKKEFSFTTDDLVGVDFDWAELVELLKSKNKEKKLTAVQLAQALHTAVVFSQKLKTMDGLNIPPHILFELVKANL